jgi:hypothetical protein
MSGQQQNRKNNVARSSPCQRMGSLPIWVGAWDEPSLLLESEFRLPDHEQAAPCSSGGLTKMNRRLVTTTKASWHPAYKTMF